MTNFERVIDLAAQLKKVEINSEDGTLKNFIFEVDTYDIYDDSISIANLDGSEILINADNIASVDGDVIYLKHLHNN